MATSMIVDGHIYGCHGDLSAFAMRCLELKTGAIKWEERVPGRYGFLALGKHIVCVHERGAVQLIEAKPDAHKVVGELPNLLAYKTWAAPAFADGKLYLRDERHVVCVDLRAK
jgi:outer membrane protein assembly factor BamB